MIYIKNFFRSIYFVFFLFFETITNFFIDVDWIIICPFFILIFYISTNIFSNENIFPIMVSGLSYDIYLSENYLGVYTILFLIVAIMSNYISNIMKNFNNNLLISFAFAFMIYNILNLTNSSFIFLYIPSVFLNYLLYVLFKKLLDSRV